MTTCTIADCARPHHARGMCDVHYATWRRARKRDGDPATQEREARFEDARFLIEWGVHPDEVARRVGTTREALEVQARRYKAWDIAKYLRPEPRGKQPGKPCPDCGTAIYNASKRCADCARIVQWGLRKVAA